MFLWKKGASLSRNCHFLGLSPPAAPEHSRISKVIRHSVKWLHEIPPSSNYFNNHFLAQQKSPRMRSLALYSPNSFVPWKPWHSLIMPPLPLLGAIEAAQLITAFIHQRSPYDSIIVYKGENHFPPFTPVFLMVFPLTGKYMRIV